jgi:uncharacterized membrane protein YuzA (DUF378 family)
MRRLDQVILAMLIFAGINWGLWGVYEFNLVYYLFGKEWVDRFIYILFGASAIYMAVIWRKIGIRWTESPRRK